MMKHNQLDLFMMWINTFDPTVLKNEDDVETKFVLPFFRYLGYDDMYRKGKHPIDDYRPGKEKRGRRPEVDQVYFSESEDTKQNHDSSLLLIEAKEPHEHNLSEAIKQAKYYGNHLTPLFLVITNGHHLIVLKRHIYRSEEIVFDISVRGLRSNTVAEQLFSQLHFETAKQLKEQGIDTLSHALYIELMNISNRYPDLQNQLAKGDFEPSIIQEKTRLTVIKPTVAIECNLPIAFKEGSCTIKFSSIMLRGLTCHLSHSEIVSNLFVGLGTSPHWETRRFLKREKDTFNTQLGRTTVILSEREAYDLCEAVDQICQKYKDLMIEATTILETWNFTPVIIDDTQGFLLLSVKRWLWNLMKEFADDFDYDNGDSAWHIFDSKPFMIRVSSKNLPNDYAIILPKTKTTYMPGYLPNDDVDLLYIDSITYLRLYRDASRKSLYEDVGPQGVWTARYTREWLLQIFIPKVLSHYLGPQSTTNSTNKELLEELPQDILTYYKKRNRKEMTTKQINTVIQEAVEDHSYEQEELLVDVNNPKQFEVYINEIQALFYGGYFAEKIPSYILQPYYKEFANIARYIDPTTINLGYIRQKLGVILRERKKQGISYEKLTTYDSILKFLDQQAAEICEVDYEEPENADLLSRVFGTIVEGEAFNVPQSQINQARQALLPLWKLCHFEMRFIEPIILDYQQKL